MGNEDTLSGFPVKEAVPALVRDEREREREYLYHMLLFYYNIRFTCFQWNTILIW